MFSSRTTKAGPSAERRKERDAAWARTKELRRRDEEAKKEDIAKIEEIEGRPFRDVPEGRFVIRPIPVEETKIKAIGTCGLLVCIGIYMRVTEKYFFLAHIQGDMTGVQLDDAFKLSEKDKEQKTKKIKIWIAKKLNKEIQEGLKQDDWNVEGAKNLIESTLTVCYTDEEFETEGGRVLIMLFKDAIREWAETGKIKYESPKCPEKYEKKNLAKGNVRKSGFVIPDPRNFDKPTWISRESGYPAEETYNKRSNYRHEDDELWSSRYETGDGYWTLSSMLEASDQ